MSDDLISRSELLEYVEFDRRVIAPNKHTATDILLMIKTAPAVDAVPVVRCKDCIGKDTWYKNEEFGVYICGLSGLYIVEDNDFCSYAERKEGDPDDL